MILLFNQERATDIPELLRQANGLVGIGIPATKNGFKRHYDNNTPSEKEAQQLLRVCEPIELQRLDLDLLDGNSTDQLCLYGMLTGNPDSKRAIEIICQCTGKVICNDVMNDGKIVPVDFLKVFLEKYDEDMLHITDTGRIVDYQKRSLSFVSPLEVFVPSEDHPERDERIAEIRSWLSM